MIALRSCLVLTLCLVPSLAAAQSRITWLQNGAFRPRQTYQTRSYIHIQGKNGDGTIAFEQDCAPIGPCVPQAASATYAATLEDFDPNREEIKAESCNGVPSTVFQQACANGALLLTMQVRLGNVDLSISFSSNQQNIGGTDSGGWRFEFAEDATKYWLVTNPYNPIPAGDYRIMAVNPTSVCSLVQANPDVIFRVPAGDAETPVNVIYTPTTCPLTLKVKGTATSGGTLTGAGEACASAGPTEVICERTVDFGAQITMTAHPNADSATRFPAYDGNVCAGGGNAAVGEVATCRFLVRGRGNMLTAFVAGGDNGTGGSSSGGSSSGGTSSGGTSSGGTASGGTSSGGTSSGGSSSGGTSSGGTTDGDGADDAGGSSSSGSSSATDPNAPSPENGGCSIRRKTGSGLGAVCVLACPLLILMLSRRRVHSA